MFISETKIRVRYSETDQMGYVYYGNYASYYEVARVEMMRELGVSYKEMEERGCMMPIVELKIKFLRPAYYDDLLKVITKVTEMPNTRMSFNYEIYNEVTGKLINTGETILAFVNIAIRKPIKAPEWFLELLKEKI